jgi:hypothetical protein
LLLILIVLLILSSGWSTTIASKSRIRIESRIKGGKEPETGDPTAEEPGGVVNRRSLFREREALWQATCLIAHLWNQL